MFLETGLRWKTIYGVNGPGRFLPCGRDSSIYAKDARKMCFLFIFHFFFNIGRLLTAFLLLSLPADGGLQTFPKDTVIVKDAYRLFIIKVSMFFNFGNV